MVAELRNRPISNRYLSVGSSPEAVEYLRGLSSSSRGSQLYRFLVTGELPQAITVVDPFPEHFGPGRLEVRERVLSLSIFGIDRIQGGSDVYQLGFKVGDLITPFRPWTVTGVSGRLRGFDFAYTFVSQIPLGWQLNDLARRLVGNSGIPMPTFNSIHGNSTARQSFAADGIVER